MKILEHAAKINNKHILMNHRYAFLIVSKIIDTPKLRNSRSKVPGL